MPSPLSNVGTPSRSVFDTRHSIQTNTLGVRSAFGAGSISSSARSIHQWQTVFSTARLRSAIISLICFVSMPATTVAIVWPCRNTPFYFSAPLAGNQSAIYALSVRSYSDQACQWVTDALNSGSACNITRLTTVHSPIIGPRIQEMCTWAQEDNTENAIILSVVNQTAAIVTKELQCFIDNISDQCTLSRTAVIILTILFVLGGTIFASVLMCCCLSTTKSVVGKIKECITSNYAAYQEDRARRNALAKERERALAEENERKLWKGIKDTLLDSLRNNSTQSLPALVDLIFAYLPDPPPHLRKGEENESKRQYQGTLTGRKRHPENESTPLLDPTADIPV